VRIQGSQGPPRPRVEEVLVRGEHAPDHLHAADRANPTQHERSPAAKEAAWHV
jgi:hypothetical protein